MCQNLYKITSKIAMELDAEAIADIENTERVRNVNREGGGCV